MSLPVAVSSTALAQSFATANGTAIDAGRVPAEDAWIVARLRAEGAIIMGKTVTAECAFMHPGKSRKQ